MADFVELNGDDGGDGGGKRPLAWQKIMWGNGRFSAIFLWFKYENGRLASFVKFDCDDGGDGGKRPLAWQKIMWGNGRLAGSVESGGDDGGDGGKRPFACFNPNAAPPTPAVARL